MVLLSWIHVAEFNTAGCFDYVGLCQLLNWRLSADEGLTFISWRRSDVYQLTKVWCLSADKGFRSWNVVHYCTSAMWIQLVSYLCTEIRIPSLHSHFTGWKSTMQWSNCKQWQTIVSTTVIKSHRPTSVAECVMDMTQAMVLVHCWTTKGCTTRNGRLHWLRATHNWNCTIGHGHTNSHTADTLPFSTKSPAMSWRPHSLIRCDTTLFQT